MILHFTVRKMTVDIIGIIMIILFTILCTYLYIEVKKKYKNEKLSHRDHNGIYWKYVSYGKHGGLYFINTESVNKIIIVDRKNIEFHTVSVIVKKAYFNGDINKLVANNLNNSITGYDVMKFYFLGRSIYLDNLPRVFLSGVITYDFNGKEINRIDDFDNVPNPSEFKAIGLDSDLKNIYDCVFDVSRMM